MFVALGTCDHMSCPHLMRGLITRNDTYYQTKPKPILTPQKRAANTLRVVLFCTFVLLATYFVGITNYSAEIVLAQMHNMTIPPSDPNSSVFPNKTTFSAIGQISSLIITVPRNDFNIAHAFNVILTGDWNLSVIKGKITNFEVNFLASPMDGTKPCIKYRISNQ